MSSQRSDVILSIKRKTTIWRRQYIALSLLGVWGNINLFNHGLIHQKLPNQPEHIDLSRSDCRFNHNESRRTQCISTQSQISKNAVKNIVMTTLSFHKKHCRLAFLNAVGFIKFKINRDRSIGHVSWIYYSRLHFASLNHVLLLASRYADKNTVEYLIDKIIEIHNPEENERILYRSTEFYVGSTTVQVLNMVSDAVKKLHLDQEDRSCFHHAIIGSQMETLQYLFSVLPRFAKRFRFDHIFGHYYNSFWCFIAEYRNAETPEIYCRQYIRRILLDAAKFSNLDIVQYLIEEVGVDIDLSRYDRIYIYIETCHDINIKGSRGGVTLDILKYFGRIWKMNHGYTYKNRWNLCFSWEDSLKFGKYKYRTKLSEQQ